MINKIIKYFKKGDNVPEEGSTITTTPYKFECPYTGKIFEGELPPDVGIIIPSEQELLYYICGVGVSGVICQHFNYFLLVSGMNEKGVEFAVKGTPYIISNTNLFVREQSEKLLEKV